MFSTVFHSRPANDPWPVEDIPDPEPSEWDITVPYWLDGMNRVKALCVADVHMTTATDEWDGMTEYCIHCGTVVVSAEEIAGERGVDW